MTSGASGPATRPLVALFDRVAESYDRIGPPFFRLFADALVAAAAVGSALLRVALWEGPASAPRLFFGSDTRAEALLVGCLVAFVVSPSSPVRPMAARAWRVPSATVRVLREASVGIVGRAYDDFHARYAESGFTRRHPEKYVKRTPEEFEHLLRSMLASTDDDE